MEMHTYGDFGRDRPNREAALLYHPLHKGLQGRHFRLVRSPDLPPPAAPEPSLSSEDDLDFYCRCIALPWRRQDGVLTVATADTTAANLTRIRTHYGDNIGIMPLAKPLLLRVLEERFAGALLEKATHSLASRFPEFSARHTITGGQIGFFVLLAAAALVAFFAFPVAANLFVAAALSVTFVANAVFRLVLVWAGAGCVEKSAVSKSPVDSDLPLYSIVVPLYREANVVPGLIAALRRLDYPAGRIEIILVLEADDAETIAAARTHASDPRFSILRVPPGLPRTKPKAANYALNFVHGEFTTIYDAEDRPEPDQLRKAVAAFRGLPSAVACLQARLNFYNAGENWLTRGIMAQTPQEMNPA